MTSSINSTTTSIQYYSGINEYTLSIDKTWTIITGTSIFSMMIGFAFLEAGSVRKKNTHIVFYKIMLHCLVIVLAYWFFGYAFSLGDDCAQFICGKRFYAGEAWDQLQESISENTQYSNWILQYGIATVVVAITNGSISERTTLVATCIQAFLMTSFIYPVVVAWTWGKGWLDSLGFIDFSGSGIVHCCGAYAGLAGLLFVGPRHNRFDEEGNMKMRSKEDKKCEIKLTQSRINQMRQRVLNEEYENFSVSNLAYALFGGLWLWFGFVFYNAGSTLGILKSSHDLWMQSEIAATNTFLAGSSAGLFGLVFKHPIMNGWKAPRKLKDEAAGVCNAYLAGMVACGAGINLYAPWAAFVAGLFGAIFYVGLCKLFDKLKIDDACEAFQLHGGAGTAGLMLNAFLHPVQGILYGNITNGRIFGVQLLGWLAIASWSFACSSLIWGGLKMLKMLRTDLRTEIVGHDFIEFAEDYDIKEEYECIVTSLDDLLKSSKTIQTEPYSERANISPESTQRLYPIKSITNRN